MAKPKKITLADGTVRYRVVFDAGRVEVTDRVTGKAVIGKDGKPVTKRRQLTRTFGKLKEANAELARVGHQRANGTYVPPSKLTLNAMLDGWLRSACYEKEAGTRSNYAHALRPARERLGERLVQSITREDVEDLRDWMASAGRKRGGKPGTGLGPRSVRLTLSRLSAAFDQALDDGKVTRNPVARVRRPKMGASKKNSWEVKEARQFLAAISGDRLHVAWLMALCGLRREEICGLQWSCVDLEAETLTIATVRVVVDGQVILKDAPKSERGARTLPLLRGMRAVFAALRKVQAAEKLAAGESYRASGYVVCDELGEAVNPEWLSGEFDRLVKDAGLRRITLHECRHTANKLMEEAGVAGSKRAAWLGHTVAVNETTYLRPQASDLPAAGDALSEIYGLGG